MNEQISLIHTNRVKRFVLFGWLTVSLIYLLILAGGVVRATGSGMGCPDWPKCFGQWIPPLEESELPTNYKSLYALKGYEDVEFNPLKTWIEYVNRLLGVLVGFSIFLFFLFSLYFFKQSLLIPVLSGLSFLLVAFQGWLGSIVVATVLKEWIITAHMVLALVIVLLVQFTVVLSRFKLLVSKNDPKNYDRSLVLLSWFTILILLTQVVLGTQVREQIDALSKAMVERSGWIEQLGISFVIHRSFSILLLITLALWSYRLYRFHTLPLFSLVLVVTLVGSEVLAGVGMAYLDVPAILQPIHLLGGSLLLGVVGYMFTKYMFSVRYSS